jgi:3-oxoacyl-[acyl-carrier-protein] synthase III
MVVQPTTEAPYATDRRHLRAFARLADGVYPTCHIGLNYRVGDRYRLHSHSSRLIRHGLQLIVELIVEVLQQDEWRGIQYDNLFIHDIGKIIDDTVLPFMREAQICVPDTYKSFFPVYGNVASASLPVGLDMAVKDGRLKRGNLAVYICPAAGVQAGILVFYY